MYSSSQSSLLPSAWSRLQLLAMHNFYLSCRWGEKMVQRSPSVIRFGKPAVGQQRRLSGQFSWLFRFVLIRRAAALCRWHRLSAAQLGIKKTAWEVLHFLKWQPVSTFPKLFVIVQDFWVQFLTCLDRISGVEVHFLSFLCTIWNLLKFSPFISSSVLNTVGLHWALFLKWKDKIQPPWPLQLPASLHFPLIILSFHFFMISLNLFGI